MKNMTQHFLSLVLALPTISVLAQQSAPIPSITDAVWADYSSMYPQSQLCDKNEITLWSCKTSKHIYSLCSSRVVTRTSGYIQYRASNHGKTMFIYPIEKRPPLGLFTYKPSANGDASIEFKNNGYAYTIYDSLRGKSSIFAGSTAQRENQTEIECQGNQTLQINYTMKLMYDSGVWHGY